MNPLPAIQTLSPSSVPAGSAAQTLTVTGSGFVQGAVVSLNGTALQTTFVNGTSLQAAVPASALVAGAATNVSVSNPSPGGGASSQAEFDVISPTPVIAAISPATLPVGKAAVITVSGTGFEANSTALWNGASRPTTVLGPTSLQVSLTAADVQSFGTGQVTVNNPGPGGSTAPAAPLPVLAPLTATALAPASVAAGGQAQTLTVTGTGFVAGSVVALDGTALQTTVASATSLRAALPAASLANGRTASVTVINPAGVANAGTSQALSLAVTAGTPVVASLAPASVGAGQAATVTITGSGFEANSVAQWNGAGRATTFTSATTLQIALSAADLASAGNGQISVANQGPGGGTSTALSLTVVGAPVIRSLSPNTFAVGAGAQTLTLTGTGFLPSSVVLADGTSLATSYVSSTSLTAILPATVLATQHTAVITVSNPGALAQVSAPASLTIGSGTPVITAVQPSYFVAANGNQPTTIAVLGSNFTYTTGAYWNGDYRPTALIEPGRLRVDLTQQDLQSPGTVQFVLKDYVGGVEVSSGSVSIPILQAPVITSYSPQSLLVNPAATQPVMVTLNGTNFDPKAKVYADGGTLIPITAQSATQIVIALPASFLTKAAGHYLSVGNPPPDGSSNLIDSVSVNLPVVDPTAPFTLSPRNAPAGSGALTLSITGQDFMPDTQVFWNGTPLSVTYTSATSLSAAVSASLLANVGVANVTLNTPEYGSQQPAAQNFTTYLSLPTNDIAWNSRDGLIYATVAGTGGPGLGNNLVGIDPATGVIQRRIFVGSEPNRLAISTDGTTAFVGLDGAGAVRQVDLVAGTAGLQFALGGGPGVYNPPYTAKSMAVLPGQPHSVALYTNAGVVTIYDSGVARPKSSTGLQTYFTSNTGGLAFGASASTLYVSSEAIGSYLYQLTVDSTGITGLKTLSTNGAGNTLQYDNGRLYFPNGVIADADTGATHGQLTTIPSAGYSASPANGPIWSDSTLNTAWVVTTDFYAGFTVQAYDETTSNPQIGQSVSQVKDKASSNPGTPADLIRWGQSGLAFHTSTSLYILQGPVVKAADPATADMQLQASVPATAATGSPVAFQFTVKNGGSSTAQGITLQVALPGTLTANSAKSSQGSCSGGGIFYCNLGSLPSGASASITLTGTPTQAGTVQADALVSAQTTDSDATNNLASASTTVTGGLFSPVPLLSGISPNLLQTGSSDTAITVSGSGFTSASSVLWNGSALPTTMVNATTLTATVSAANLAAFGSAQVSVISAAPGGGTSNAATVTLYRILNVPANALTWDPFTRLLYAALPSTATSYTGNSLVTIDPATGVVGQPVLVGSEPNLLAETTSGNYLYVGLNGARSVGRFNMLTQSIDATASLLNTRSIGGPTAAYGLATLPGLDNTVSAAGAGILDFVGSTATQRPNSDVGFNNAIFPDAGHVYTYDDLSTGAEFYRSTVDSSGVHQQDGTTLLGMGGLNGSLALDGGLIYGSGGGIANPSTPTPGMVGLLPLGGTGGVSFVGAGVVPYATEQKSFNLAENIAGTQSFVLERFDTSNFVLEDSLPMYENLIGTVLNGTRWGQDGLAYILAGGYTGHTEARVLLMRGAFVLPSETTSHPAPVLAAAGTGTLTAGSGNQRVVVTGTGFLPGATVLWNSTAQDTTFVDAQHLSVAVGAAQVKSAATISITCQNPGSTASNSVQFTLQ